MLRKSYDQMGKIIIAAEPEISRRFSMALPGSVTAMNANELSALSRGAELLIVSMKLGDCVRLCDELRTKYDFQLITISASDKKEDILAGLSVGDDCVSPDCPPPILRARVEARLRRTRDPDQLIVYNELKLDALSGKASIGENALRLTQREFSILLYLAENAELVVDRGELLKAVWGEDRCDPNLLWLTISRLKQKLDSDSTGLTITAVRGRGYLLEQL